MLLLKELIDNLSKYNNQPLKAWLSTNVSTTVVQLYLGIARGFWENDASASIALYGKPDSPAYRKTKFDLKAKLIDFILFIELEETNNEDTRLKEIKSLEKELIIKKLEYLDAISVLNELKN